MHSFAPNNVGCDRCDSLIGDAMITAAPFITKEPNLSNQSIRINLEEKNKLRFSWKNKFIFFKLTKETATQGK